MMNYNLKDHQRFAIRKMAETGTNFLNLNGRLYTYTSLDSEHVLFCDMGRRNKNPDGCKFPDKVDFVLPMSMFC